MYVPSPENIKLKRIMINIFVPVGISVIDSTVIPISHSEERSSSTIQATEYSPGVEKVITFVQSL